MTKKLSYPVFSIQNASDQLSSIKFKFSGTPIETASIQSPTVAWLSGTALNDETSTGLYSILSPYDNLNTASVYLSLNVKGSIKRV
jgi:hypothetical protein